MSDKFSSCKLCHLSWINFQNSPQPNQPIKFFQRAELPILGSLVIDNFPQCTIVFRCLKCPTENQLMSTKYLSKIIKILIRITWLSYLTTWSIEINFHNSWIQHSSLFSLSFVYELVCICLDIAVTIMENSSQKLGLVRCRTYSASCSCYLSKSTL